MPYSYCVPGSATSGAAKIAFDPESTLGVPVASSQRTMSSLKYQYASPLVCVTSWRTVARVARRAQARLVTVEALEHLEVGELREELVDRRVEVELAALDELERRRRGDDLRHRGDPEHGVRRHRVARADGPRAGRALITQRTHIWSSIVNHCAWCSTLPTRFETRTAARRLVSGTAGGEVRDALVDRAQKAPDSAGGVSRARSNWRSSEALQNRERFRLLGRFRART